jgi:hypothetical protein
LTILTVPKPILRFEAAGGGVAALEKPVTVMVGPVKDGATVVGADKLAIYGLFTYRRLTSGAGIELWDGDAKTWLPDPGAFLKGKKTSQLAFKQGDPNPWSGILVAASGQDSAGKPQFAKAVGGYPIYTFRAWFSSKDGAVTGLSDPSDNVTFAGVSDKNLFVVGPGDDEKPEAATQSRLILKNTALQTIGQVLIERDSPGARVTVQNSAGASIVLYPDGHIELNPAAGQDLVVNADLNVGRITYQPGGGGAKVTL